MADLITDRTCMIRVCNPNNPTGDVNHVAELEVFLDRVPDGVRICRDRPNVAVLRTFFKVYGLAGLRGLLRAKSS